MDLTQIKIITDLFIGTIAREIIDLAKDIVILDTNNACKEMMEKQMELAEIVYYYETTGVLTTLRIHYPAMNELFDKVLKLRQNEAKEFVDDSPDFK